MTPDAAMFFAAGLGTRMRPLTDDRPKPLVRVGGVTLLDHALNLGRAAGLRRRVVNVHYRGQMIRDHLAGQDIAVSDESETLLDTGGGLRKALPLLGPGPVFTMNTDAIWQGPNPFEVLAGAWDPDRMDALLLLIPPGQGIGHRGAGDFRLGPTGGLTRGPGLIYSGAQIIAGAALDPIEEDIFSLNTVWNALERDGRLHGVSYSGRWCDVGRPESIPLARSLLPESDHV